MSASPSVAPAAREPSAGRCERRARAILDAHAAHTRGTHRLGAAGSDGAPLVVESATPYIRVWMASSGAARTLRAARGQRFPEVRGSQALVEVQSGECRE